METKEVHVGGVRVVNRNDFDIKDMFDGVPFTFKQGVAETIPPDAANHIFGWRHLGEDEDPKELAAEMLLYCQKRHGWNTPDVVRAGNHQKFFDAIEFKPVRFRMVEVIDDEGELPTIAESPRQPRKPHENKLMAAASAAEARNATPR